MAVHAIVSFSMKIHHPNLAQHSKEKEIAVKDMINPNLIRKSTVNFLIISLSAFQCFTFGESGKEDDKINASQTLFVCFLQQ